MPDLADAQRRHTDVAFLFVNQGESADKVQAFLARSGLALDEVWLDQGSSLGRAIRSPGLPTTVFLDAQGRQVDAHFGVLSAASLQAKVEALRRRKVPGDKDPARVHRPGNRQFKTPTGTFPAPNGHGQLSILKWFGVRETPQRPPSPMPREITSFMISFVPP
jgi:hypothetical protein